VARGNNKLIAGKPEDEPFAAVHRPSTGVRAMSESVPKPVAAFRSTLPLLSLLLCGLAWSQEPAAPVIDSQAIVRGLSGPAVSTRGFAIEAKPGDSAGGGGDHKVNLDIRFANDSGQLTPGAQTQLAQLGRALNSPELAHQRFLIAGHTSATGSAKHNQQLSELRARAVRAYLLEHFHIAPARIDATGYGSSRPLPDFPPEALQQRRVEISALPAAS
jgi:outer membrane protein OmpA-like peptidoglycan-associated protein